MPGMRRSYLTERTPGTVQFLDLSKEVGYLVMEGHRDCFLEGCVRDGTMRCSRCKLAHYCSREHQSAHWKLHKLTCYECTPEPKRDSVPSAAQERKESSASTESDVVKKQCRCMFCGDQLVLGSEEEAVDHMRVCPALQEQLASKDQFTVPSMVRKKMKGNIDLEHL